ncbi:Tpr-related protein family member, putative [Theileria annulata]|uniref:Tpr-related protein family member, putative n=1 Tax=Theileria annulata TaxID=5874 RepID=Q4UBL7_THEAN|nr:Tpr-related protein family member, putative [Theileria annulata]CAI75784.1 Tpr-related protein family member, putative [Theileria annulata]|eukprot:XP_955260.1 Tpr-related protein family member, putative [Theileria annulata]
MSTALSITFYMCHEILLAIGFAGMVGNSGADYVMLPVIIAILRRYKGKLGKWLVLQPGCKWGSDAIGFGNKWINSGESATGGTSGQDAWHWHVIGLILMILKISLAAIFIYSLHYRDHIGTDEDVILPMQLVDDYLLVFIDILVAIII